MKENQKLNKKILAEECAISSVSGVRKAWNADTVASGLTPSKLASIIQDANEGKADEYLTLAEEMEEREPHYGSVLRTRKLAIEGLDKTVEAGSDINPKIVEAVENLINASAFDDLVSGLADGLGKGYSAVEIMWNDDFIPARYVWRDQRYFCFTKDNAYKLLLKDEDGQGGSELPAYKFVVHTPKLKSGVPIRGGLARMSALSYMCKTYALTDWMAFCEVFGMPIRIGKYDGGASDEDKAILKRAVTYIGTDAAAIIPESMTIEFEEAASAKGGENIFETLANWLDKQISKAVLGQTMTADDGSSQAQAKVHNEVRTDLLRTDAKQLAATINEQLIKPFVDLHFGVQKEYPRVSFYIAEAEDINALVDGVSKLVPLGLRVPQNFLRDKLGIPDPGEDDELLAIPQAPMVPGMNACKHSVALNNTADEDMDEDYGGFVNMTQKAIEELAEKLKQANSFEEIIQLLNEVEMNTSDIAEALAIAGVKAFADGVADV
ncbi:MAG: DUF935 domain-containing protein [Gammaproteobacteria bacterium]|nr:DUF935 domain-containing protein [Gammaproteobacteria bacterium]